MMSVDECWGMIEQHPMRCSSHLNMRQETNKRTQKTTAPSNKNYDRILHDVKLWKAYLNKIFNSERKAI